MSDLTKRRDFTPTMAAALLVLARDPRKRHPAVLRDGTLKALQRRGLAAPTPGRDINDVPVWSLTDVGREAHAELVGFCALEHTGNSANIHYYREVGGRDPEPYLYVRDLVTGTDWKTRKPLDRVKHSFSVTRNRFGDITSFTYYALPGQRGHLDGETVSHLVREALR